MKVNFRAITMFSCLLVSLILLASCSNCSKNSDSNHKFKVGMECAYAPFSWVQPNSGAGAVKISGGWYAGGYDVEIAKKIAAGMGRELVIVKLDWNGLLPALTSGKIDAIIGGMSATDARKEAIDFTDKYYESDIVVVVKKDGPYSSSQSIYDFAGAKITGQMGTFHYGLIDQIKGVEKKTAMLDFASMVVALGSGKIDGYISERPGAIAVAATNSKLEYIEFEKGKGFNFTRDETEIAIGIKKGNAKLKNEINKILGTISEETRTQLVKKAIEHQPAAKLK